MTSGAKYIGSHHDELRAHLSSKAFMEYCKENSRNGQRYEQLGATTCQMWLRELLQRCGTSLRHVPAAAREEGMSVSSFIMSCVAHLFGPYLYLIFVHPAPATKRMMLGVHRYDPGPDRASENFYMRDGVTLVCPIEVPLTVNLCLATLRKARVGEFGLLSFYRGRVIGDR